MDNIIIKVNVSDERIPEIVDSNVKKQGNETLSIKCQWKILK